MTTVGYLLRRRQEICGNIWKICTKGLWEELHFTGELWEELHFTGEILQGPMVVKGFMCVFKALVWLLIVDSWEEREGEHGYGLGVHASQIGT